MKKIILSVIFVHLVVLFFLSSPRVVLQQKPKPLSVHTFQMTSPSLSVNSSTPSVQREKKPCKKKVSQKQKKLNKAPVARQQSKQISSFSVDRKWKELDEALAKIENKIYAKPHLPGEMECENSREILAAFLRNSLKFPELGIVELQLCIDTNGKMSRLTILKWESQKNKVYLEETLPLLRFPLVLGEQKIFNLILCNEI